LFLNNPTEKVAYTRLCENIVRSQLAQYSWASATQFWGFAFHSHSSCCCQQGTSDLSEVGLKLLPSLKTYMWYCICGIYHYLYYGYMPWVSQHFLFNCTYMQHATNCLAKCIHHLNF